LLVKKDRGRPVDPKARPKAFGEVTVASDVPGAELLDENISSEGEGSDNESDAFETICLFYMYLLLLLRHCCTGMSHHQLGSQAQAYHADGYHHSLKYILSCLHSVLLSWSDGASFESVRLLHYSYVIVLVQKRSQTNSRNR
jgi:hypothetical protein